MAQNSDPQQHNDPREKISKWVTLTSIGGVLLLALVVIFMSRDKETTRMVFTAVLPLFGAWVGTILAFYFGKESFEAASRSVTNIAKTVGFMEKLKEVKVKDKMIRREDMSVIAKADNEIAQIKLKEILNTITSAGKGVRLPILNDKDNPVYMIHRSMVDKFLATQALSPSPPQDPSALILNDFLTDTPLKNMVEKSFTAVKEDATMAEAKNAMDRTPHCQDVFVTNGGTLQEPVIGWITNGIIQQIATV